MGSRKLRKKRDALPARKASTAGEEILARLKREGITTAKIGGFDIDGVLRGKYVSIEKLASALREGFGFCDVIFGWDMADVVYDKGSLTGPDTGYPDAQAILDPNTLRFVPWETGTVALLADFRDAAGQPHPGCARSTLKRVLDRCHSMGFEAKIGVEYEFFFFNETRETLVEKDFRRMEPLDPGMFGYSWVRSGQDSELVHEVLHGMREFDINIEGLHTETGPGVYEAALRYDEALRAADQAALFKTAIKQIAHRRGLSVTFMAKWNAALPGCSGHLHQSLWQKGKNAFYDVRGARGMSVSMKRYIAGQVALMQELTALYSPTINSYKRYVPGVWAPLCASWGVENRNAAVRVIGIDDPKACRVEYRQTAADINPYLAIAASLGAGLWGIEKRLELPPETLGDPGAEGPMRLPHSLAEAADRLAESQAARAILGAPFVDHYVATRRWEVRCFDKAVTDWELRRYFELV